MTGLIIAYGWRESFYLLAPAGLLAAIWWWWYGRDEPAQHAAVTPAELALISAGRPPPGATAAVAGNWRSVLWNRDILLLAASYFSMNYVFYIFSNWLFTYLVEERGFSLLESGFLYALPFIVGAVLATVGGIVCDHLCRRLGPRWGCRLPGVVGLMMVAWLLLAGAASPSPLMAVALLSLCFGFTQFTEGAYWQGVDFRGRAAHRHGRGRAQHRRQSGGVPGAGGRVHGRPAGLVADAGQRLGFRVAWRRAVAVRACGGAGLYGGRSLMIRSLSQRRPVVLIMALVAASLGSAMAATKPRARDLGIPFDGNPGPLNAITDVAGVEVGHVTLISGSGKLKTGSGPVRTGVTAILPRGKDAPFNPVFAGWFTQNGNGEMTGTTWVEESGLMYGPVMITSTHSVGVVRDAVIAWANQRYHFDADEDRWSEPVVAETWDQWLNDIYGFHVKPEHAFRALDSAAPGPVPEGNVGGGTGMICFHFKGGIGTSSRRVHDASGDYTLGVLVQANFGSRAQLTIAGVPVGNDHYREPGLCRARRAG